MPALVDRQTHAFLVSVWLLAFLLVFGLETKLFLRAGMAVVPAVIGVLLTAAVALVRWRLTKSRATFVTLHNPNGRRRVPLRPANAAVQRFVEGRAERLGVVDVDVFTIPNTAAYVDGFAIGSRRRGRVVLTIGAQGLLFAGDARRNDFAFLVDHEVAHLASGDAASLYQARAVLLCAFAALALKVTAWLAVGWSAAMEWYQPVFPRSLYVDAGLAAFPQLRQVPTSLSAVLAFVIGYSCLTLVALVFAYVGIVRHREYWADRQAIAGSDDPIGAQRLFAGAGDPADAASRRGLRIWHPSLKARLASLQSPNSASGYHYGTTGAFALLALFSFRLAVGNTGVSPEFDQYQRDLVFWLSWAFAAASVYVVGCLLLPIELQAADRHSDHALRRDARLRFAINLIVVTAAMLAAELTSWWSLVAPADDVHRSPYFHIVRIEQIENLLLFLSIPLSLAIAAVSIAVISRPNAPRRTFEKTVAIALCATISLSIALAYVLQPPLARWYEAEMNAFDDGLFHLSQALVRDALGSETKVLELEHELARQVTSHDNYLYIYRTLPKPNALSDLDGRYKAATGTPLFPDDDDVRFIYSSQMVGPRRAVRFPVSAFLLSEGSYHVPTSNELFMYRLDHAINRSIETYLRDYGHMSPQDRARAAAETARKLTH